MSPLSKRIALAVSFLLLLPAIAVVAAPPTSLHVGTPSISPAAPGPNDQVTVNVTVTASVGVKNVTIRYTTDNWKTTNTTVLASFNATTQQALAHIPPQYSGGQVEYYIIAFDNNNNKAVNNNGGSYYSYTVAAPASIFNTSSWIETAIVLTAVGAAVSVGVYSLRSKPTTSSRQN